MRLDDAAKIVAQQPANFERAAIRWLERFVSEKAKTLDDIGAALDALAEQPMELPALLRLAG